MNPQIEILIVPSHHYTTITHMMVDPKMLQNQMV
jgi:hypothetical protein